MGYKVLELDNVSKNFGDISVLKNISLNLFEGELHFLAGENGAGKSTLMKIVSGNLCQSSGEINFQGNSVEMCHQELSLLENLSVVDNFFLGREISKFSFIRRKIQKERMQKWLKKVSLKLSGDELVRNLSLSQKYLLEMARVISRDSKILILDEPTGGLSQIEAEIIFKVIFELKKAGKAVFYISHKMHEMLLLADRITVLRDGEKISTIKIADYCEEKFIKDLVGRSLGEYFPQREAITGECVLEIERPSLKLFKGEILGLAGLEGSGHREVFNKIFFSPEKSIANGQAYVTNDRKNTGLILNHSILQNISLPIYKRESLFSLIREKNCKKIALSLKEGLKIKSENLEKEVGLLSGGNQQKVVLAKWLATDPQILILDEPTRGIDIGAKVEIYQLLCDFVNNGGAILLYSSEMNELLGLSDRIVTLYQGQIQNFYGRKEIDLQEKIMSDIIGAKYANPNFKENKTSRIESDEYSFVAENSGGPGLSSSAWNNF